MASTRKSPQIKLNVLVYKEEKEWIAHCLQMDLVASSKSRQSVEKNMIDLIAAQVTFALENDNLGAIFMSAPQEEWRKLEKATFCESRRLNIVVEKEAQPKKRSHSAVKEVEFCFA